MRVTKTRDGLKVHAVAGTYVVLLGWTLPESDCNGLLGFALHRTDHTEDEAYYMEGMKAFAETDPGFPAGSTYSTRSHPIQSFQWSDYTAKPGHKYTYRLTALKGTPKQLTEFKSVQLTVDTESPENGDHDVYFNSGVAGSQAYVRRFGNKAPKDVPNNAAFDWLSRGAYEAMAAYVDSCEGGRDALRIAAYEFRYPEFLARVKTAVDRGVDVRIVHDCRKAFPRDENKAALAAAGLSGLAIERKTYTSAIHHNKFIVRLRDDAPIAVWTGGMNISEGGIFGQSNVAHVVEDAEVARKFLDYWEILSKDPARAETQAKVEALTGVPTGKPPKGTTCIFSPRKTLAALDWYAARAMEAKEGLMMTFAFGMNAKFKDVYRNGQAKFRLALMEKATGPSDDPARIVAEKAEIAALRRMP